MSSSVHNRRRELALYILCLGVLMIVLDTTIITVALPSMVDDLRVPRTAVTWLLNSYELTYGGFLLLSGRVADLYGARRVFLAGLGVFTLASLACGLAQTTVLLLVARGVQGVGGAAVTAASLALINNLFERPGERVRAIAIYGLVSAAGGGIGDLVGGVLTNALSWHWIFLVNVPTGFAVFALSVALVPRDSSVSRAGGLDVWGAVTITLALTALIYSLVDAIRPTAMSGLTRTLVGVIPVLLALFLGIEARASQPLVPLRLFRSHNFSTVNVLAVLWSAGALAWFVIVALYLQRVLAYSPFAVGLAFLPSTVVMGMFSAGLAGRVVLRFGVRGPLWMGLLLVAAGIGFFGRAPLTAKYVVDVLPGMILFGVGGGMAYTPMLIGAMNEVRKGEAGLASGIVNTAFVLGGAVGLAVLTSVADFWTTTLESGGIEVVAALNSGYHYGFLGAALLVGAAALVGRMVLRIRPAFAERALS